MPTLLEMVAENGEVEVAPERLVQDMIAERYLKHTSVLGGVSGNDG